MKFLKGSERDGRSQRDREKEEERDTRRIVRERQRERGRRWKEGMKTERERRRERKEKEKRERDRERRLRCAQGMPRTRAGVSAGYRSILRSDYRGAADTEFCMKLLFRSLSHRPIGFSIFALCQRERRSFIRRIFRPTFIPIYAHDYVFPSEVDMDSFFFFFSFFKRRTKSYTRL